MARLVQAIATSTRAARGGPDKPGHDGKKARSVSTTANHRSVGTGIATVSEEGSGILSGDAVERGSECVLQRLDGACGDPAEVGFHLGPGGLDRAEVRAIAGQVAIGKS